MYHGVCVDFCSGNSDTPTLLALSVPQFVKKDVNWRSWTRCGSIIMRMRLCRCGASETSLCLDRWTRFVRWTKYSFRVSRMTGSTTRSGKPSQCFFQFAPWACRCGFAYTHNAGIKNPLIVATGVVAIKGRASSLMFMLQPVWCKMNMHVFRQLWRDVFPWILQYVMYGMSDSIPGFCGIRGKLFELDHVTVSLDTARIRPIEELMYCCWQRQRDVSTPNYFIDAGIGLGLDIHTTRNRRYVMH